HRQGYSRVGGGRNDAGEPQRLWGELGCDICCRRLWRSSGRAEKWSSKHRFDLLLYWCRVSPRSTSARGWRRNLASERRLLDVSCEFGDEQPAKGGTSREPEQRGNGPNHLPRSRD